MLPVSIQFNYELNFPTSLLIHASSSAVPKLLFCLVTALLPGYRTTAWLPHYCLVIALPPGYRTTAWLPHYCLVTALLPGYRTSAWLRGMTYNEVTQGPGGGGGEVSRDQQCDTQKGRKFRAVKTKHNKIS